MRRTSRNAKRPGGLWYPLLLAALAILTAAVLKLGLDARSQGDYLASLTPTPTLVPRRVSYLYDNQTPAPTPLMISAGKEGPLVRAVQERLKALGFYEGDLDGQFGAQTKDAVVRFQQSAGLTADGVVGQKTYDALFPR